jgi:hypothetical protein
MVVLLVLVVQQVLGRGVSLEPGRELRNGQLGHGEGLFFLESVLLATVELAFFLFLLFVHPGSVQIAGALSLEVGSRAGQSGGDGRVGAVAVFAEVLERGPGHVVPLSVESGRVKAVILFLLVLFLVDDSSLPLPLTAVVVEGSAIRQGVSAPLLGASALLVAGGSLEGEVERVGKEIGRAREEIFLVVLFFLLGPVAGLVMG